MSKTIKLNFLLILLVGMLAFTAMTASAATTTATKASIAIAVYQDNAKTPITNFTSSSISVKNSAGETLDQGIDYTISSSSGLYSISELVYADTYYVTFSSATQSATSIVTVKISNTPTKATLIWSASNNYTAAKSGVITGLTVNGGGAVLTGVTVKAFTKNTIYETTSAAITGAYKLFVPAGNYTLVIVGKDTATDYANISESIKVVAGQASGPMIDKNGQTPWASMPYNSAIGLTNLIVSGTSKSVYGTTYQGATVSVYVYNNTNPIIYKYLGSQKVTAKGSTGTFNIKIPEYLADKKVAIRVVDAAFNAYEDTTYVTSALPKMTVTLKGDSAAYIASAVNITETEPTGVASGNFNKNITSVQAVYSGGTITLTSSQYSTATTGKLIINKGVLSTATDYTINVSATGYNNVSVTQPVGVTNTTPPTLTGTFTVKTGGGTVSGSAQFSAIGTAGTGNSLAYVVSSKNTIQVKLSNTLTGYTTLVAATDITGVSASTTKYIHVYEISSSHAVVKAKVFTLTTAQIK